MVTSEHGDRKRTRLSGDERSDINGLGDIQQTSPMKTFAGLGGRPFDGFQAGWEEPR